MCSRVTQQVNYLSIVAIILFLLLWETVHYAFSIREIILPAPHQIIDSLLDNVTNLVQSALITSLEAITGFLIGSSASIVIAILFTIVPMAKKIAYPHIIAIQAAPVLAFSPLIILWFGNGIASKIVMASLVSFFPVLTNMIKGLNSVEGEVVDLFTSFNATTWQTLFKLRFPSSLKYLFPALKTSITFAVAGATIAEFTGSSKGIGNVIVNASYYVDTSLLFAAILAISIVGVVLFYLLHFIEKRLVDRIN